MKKRILFMLYYLEIGGAEKVLVTLLQNFDYSRFDVELFLVYPCGALLEDIPSNVKIRYLFRRYDSFLVKVLRNLHTRFGLDFYSFYTKIKFFGRYDIIISFIGGSILKYHRYILGLAKKNISWVHTDILRLVELEDENLFCSKKEQKEIYDRMDKIVFVSNDAKTQFEKLYPLNNASKNVVFNLIDRNLISLYRKEYKRYFFNRCFNIVYVGRLSGEKGIDRLIRLARRLKEESYNFRIEIIGDGYLRRELENLILLNDVVDNVFLLGSFNPPYEVMASADLFILPSKLEGFSLVVAEALCLGLPIVSTKTTGPIELLDNDKYGILTEHDDESIYKAVKRMIDDDSLREYYHKQSCLRAEVFEVDSIIKQVYNILE